MAGHSKWANIKHRKGAADARKSKMFSKLAKYIVVAARSGGGNPQENLQLRYAIEKAKAESMPKDSIERAIKKGTGELQGEELTELTYEAIGPSGIALVIEALTDNRTRTGGEIRNLLEKRGGSLGKTNSVMWKFDRQGLLEVSKEDATEEELFEQAIEAGAENLVSSPETYAVSTRSEDFERVRSALERFLEAKRGIGAEKRWGEAEDDRPIFARSELVYFPQNPVVVTDPEKARQALDFLEAVEEHDDVQNVYSDLEVPEEILDGLARNGD